MTHSDVTSYPRTERIQKKGISQDSTEVVSLEFEQLISKLGLKRELQQERTDLPLDPSRGGSRGYSVYFCEKILEHAAENGDADAAEVFGCSTRSIDRWRNQLIPF